MEAAAKHLALPQKKQCLEPAPRVTPRVERVTPWPAVTGLGAALIAVCLAIWCTPWFFTQDGAAHLYNAHLLLELQQGVTPIQQVYQAHWLPLPNLAGHLLLMGLLTALPAWLADRVLITLTFAGLATVALWLRVQVAGWQGAWAAGLFAGLLALNWMWLMGFYNFLLGAMLFALTLGLWWRWREQLTWRRAALLMVLLIAGYFCHLFSLGLTVLGLGSLSLLTPGSRRLRRIGWTVLSGLPLLPLLLFYRNLAQHDRGPVQASWKGLTSVWSLQEWLVRWQATETLQLSGRKLLPFGTSESLWHVLVAPTVLAAGGIGLLCLASSLAVSGQRRAEGRALLHLHRGWLVLLGMLCLGCAFAPDQLGDRHGGFMRQRLLLVGLLTLLPLLQFESKSRLARLGRGLLAAALFTQVLWVWDYARTNNRLALEFFQAQAALAQNSAAPQFIGTLLLPELRTPEPAGNYQRGVEQVRYTARPLLHLDDFLGLEANRVVWNNYEATQYYFPVKHRTEMATWLAHELDLLNKRTLPKTPAELESYKQDWLNLLACAHQDMTTLVVWGGLPELESQLGQWYDPVRVYTAGRVRIFQHR